MAQTRAQLFELAHQLGHTNPAMYETAGGRWFVTCACGYESATRTSEALALEAGIHHALKAARESVRNGATPKRVKVRARA